MDNASKLIDKIKEENIKNKPRWRFTLKNMTTLIGAILALLFGSLAFSVILFAIQQVDFNIIDQIYHIFTKLPSIVGAYHLFAFKQFNDFLRFCIL